MAVQPVAVADRLVEPAYRRVADVFDDILTRSGGGGALTVYRHAVPVVDVWGGTTTTGEPWTRDTVCVGWSTSKGVTALVVQWLVERGLLDLDVPIAEYWPEFAADGKDTVTLRHVLTHTAGLPTWPGYAEIVSLGSTEGWDRSADIAEAVAAAPLLWPAGAATAYHAITYGWILDETVARATGADLDQHLRTAIAGPLGARVSFGLGDNPSERWARLREPLLPAAGAALEGVLRGSDPATLAGAAMLTTSRESVRRSHLSANSASFAAGRVPGANAFLSAHGLATLYAPLANDGVIGGVRLITPESIAEHSRPHVIGIDLVLGAWLRRGLGYVRSSAGEAYGLREAAFGHAGLGGQLGFADPSTGIAVGFVTDTPVCAGVPDWRTHWLVPVLYGAVAAIVAAEQSMEAQRSC